ncbi:RES family NAD+ phosphorylase [Burkholderia multivorans]|uniref:RES family NAD+ phosphorylase n=1 Tax=Burkholderia multivorans TaxID=87883 RepID=UPI001C246B0D|nr:RES domain-containing protein [Burkholderia multivorans]MBU9607289.1 RES domain-containing protein [Burkholderia multivorans]MBU9623051.1 RES domain-containing protein [Burkholderia multivorans]
MKLFRIADARNTIWSGTGAMLVGGRFNSPGRPVIYAAFTFAGAMLEVLVHARIGKVPKTHGWVEATVPDDIVVERHTADTLPAGWDAAAPQPARRFGDAWLTESRTAVLVVPSVVARAEFNVLVNPAHPDAARIVVTDPRPVVWDERLFVMPPVGRS